MVIVIANIVVGAITSGIDVALGATPEEPSIVGGLVNLTLGTVISMGVLAFFLDTHDNPQTADLSALWHPQQF